MSRRVPARRTAPYGLDGFEPFRSNTFLTEGFTQHLIKWVMRLFPAGKVAGSWRCLPTSSTEAKEKVELYFYPVTSTLKSCHHQHKNNNHPLVCLKTGP
jgi:hypothetical protein